MDDDTQPPPKLQALVRQTHACFLNCRMNQRPATANNRVDRSHAKALDLLQNTVVIQSALTSPPTSGNSVDRCPNAAFPKPIATTQHRWADRKGQAFSPGRQEIYRHGLAAAIRASRKRACPEPYRWIYTQKHRAGSTRAGLQRVVWLPSRSRLVLPFRNRKEQVSGRHGAEQPR